jgi:ABC-type phosphate transport system substrate-binding protein
MGSMTVRYSGRALLVAVALALLGACGGDNSSSAPPGTTTTVPAPGSSTAVTASAALCSARDALKSSIQSLTSVDVVKNGTSSLQSALEKVKTDLQAVKAAASAELQPQVKALEDSLQQLGTALTNTGASGVAGVVSAATAVAQSGSALMASLQSLKCS